MVTDMWVNSLQFPWIAYIIIVVSERNDIMNDNEIKNWVAEAASDFYWNFRDDLDDQSAELMKEELDKLKARMLYIIKNSLQACSPPE